VDRADVTDSVCGAQLTTANGNTEVRSFHAVTIKILVQSLKNESVYDGLTWVIEST
jgi:hypothetical protein